MRYLGIFLIIGFIGLAVFGFLGMHSEMQDHNGDCAVATVQGGDCPKQSNLFNYITFHLDIFKSFSIAIFEESLLIFILTIVLLSIFFGLSKLLENLIFFKLNFICSRYRQLELFGLYAKRKFFHWLAFHENSPSIL